MDQDANPYSFSLFGYGAQGLPSEVDLWLGQKGEPERVAGEIIRQWYEWAEARNYRGRRRVADAQLAELSTLAFIIVLWHTKRQVPIPPIVCEALGHIMGQVNPRTGEAIPSQSALKQLGFPAVKKIQTLFVASRIDAEHVAARLVEDDLHTPVTDWWAKIADFLPTLYQLEKSVTEEMRRQLMHRLKLQRGANLPDEEISEAEVAEAMRLRGWSRLGATRATLRAWRKLSAYQRRVRTITGLIKMTPSVYEGWNAPHLRCQEEAREFEERTAAKDQNT